MRYISDKTNKVYDSVEELEKAEKKFDDATKAEELKKAQRETRWNEVEDAYKVYRNLLTKYEKDYPECIWHPIDFLNW